MADFDNRSTKGVLRRVFEAPRLPGSYVFESRMTRHVDDVSAWRFCLVSAAAGYGKTMLLSQWYAHFESKPGFTALWMTLTSANRTSEGFARGFAGMLAKIDPRFGALEGRKGSADGALEAFTDVLNLLDEACDPSSAYIVFFDGYDAASSNEFDNALLFLNRFAPSNMRFIMSGSFFSRRMDDLLLDASVIEFASRDLALTDERARALAWSLIPDLTEQGYRSICEKIGMWPMGFSFVSLARRRARSDSDVEREFRRYCERFFAREVMDRVDATLYSFLIETAIVDEMTPHLCDAITADGQSRAILDYLAAHNYFVSRDLETGTYRRAEAFTLYLRDRLLELRLSQISRLSARAASWYAEAGMERERAKCVALTCDPGYVQGMVKGSVGLSSPHGDFEDGSFTEYLLSQPAQRFGEDRYLMWVSVWSFISTGDAATAKAWLSRVADLDAACGTDDAAACRYAEAICAPLEGDSARSLATIREVLEAGGEDLPYDFRCLLVHMEAENCERLGHFKEARDLYAKSLSLAERSDSPFYRLFDLYLLAQHYVASGSFEDATEIIGRGLAACSEDSPLYGALNASLAFVQIERRELDAAARCVKRATGHVSIDANSDMYVDAYTARARFEWAEGRRNEALRVASDLVERLEGRIVPRNMAAQAYGLLADFAARMGEITVARRQDSKLDDFIGSSDLFRSIPCMIAKSRILWGFGDQEGCLAMLSRARDAAKQADSPYYLARALVVEAEFLYQADRRVQASVSLERALELAMRGGYVDVFLTGDQGVRALLLDIAAGRRGSLAVRRYARRAAALFGSEQEARSTLAHRQGEVQGYYALTEREQEILHMLSSGMSRRELAESLAVSQNTVKSHLKSIYSKLGVHTRSEALRAAQEAQGPRSGESDA